MRTGLSLLLLTWKAVTLPCPANHLWGHLRCFYSLNAVTYDLSLVTKELQQHAERLGGVLVIIARRKSGALRWVLRNAARDSETRAI